MTAYASPSDRKGLLRIYTWPIVLATLVTLGTACVVALTRPTTYVATAQVVVGPELAGGTALRPEMASEREIASSGAVTARAADLLGVDPSKAAEGLEVSAVVESSVLDIRYTSTDAQTAAAGARAFAQSYVDQRNSMSGADRIARVVTWPDVVETSGVNVPLTFGVAVLGGLLLGVAAAWLWDRAGDRVHDAAELTEHSGLPILARVPSWGPGRSVAPEGPAAEAFAYIAARLGTLTSHRRDGVKIVVTSPRSGAGTTTVAANTACALAAQGREVVVVGADVHDPQLHEIFGVSPAPGLLDLLQGDVSLEAARRHTQRAQLSVVPVGERHPTAQGAALPVDMLRLVLSHLGSHAIVVVDAPPVLDSASSLLLADNADVVLLVGDLRSGRRTEVAETLRLLEAARPAIAGWVVNLPRGRSAATPDAARSLPSEPEAGSRERTDNRSDPVTS